MKIEINEYKVTAGLVSPVTFVFVSDLHDSDKAPILDKIALILTKYKDHTIEIEGHTDNVPIHTAKFQNNNDHYRQRANAARPRGYGTDPCPRAHQQTG